MSVSNFSKASQTAILANALAQRYINARNDIDKEAIRKSASLNTKQFKSAFNKAVSAHDKFQEQIEAYRNQR